MTDALSKDERKKFVWAEISYLDLWWNEQGEAKREQFRKSGFLYVHVARALIRMAHAHTSLETTPLEWQTIQGSSGLLYLHILIAKNLVGPMKFVVQLVAN